MEDKIEAEIMREDIDEKLNLKDVKITGECVVTEDNLTYYKTEITDEVGQVHHLWFAMEADQSMVVSDMQPEGIHIPAKMV